MLHQSWTVSWNRLVYLRRLSVGEESSVKRTSTAVTAAVQMETTCEQHTQLKDMNSSKKHVSRTSGATPL